MDRSMSDDKKFEILARETLFQGYFRVDRYHIQHERFDGEWSQPFTREIFNYGRNVAGVLLFDPQQDKVVMVEQFRTCPVVHGEHPWLMEIVMGMIDAGETPEQAARREALEEAGCDVLEVQPIFNYYTSPGATSDHVTIFVGRIRAPVEGFIGGVATENEDIRVHVVDAVKAIGMLFGNKIRDAQTLVALQWFAMHRTELRSRWLVSDVGTPII
jgi:ADP-ribose pyrophosphatase